jgi:hypothetical protein
LGAALESAARDVRQTLRQRQMVYPDCLSGTKFVLICLDPSQFNVAKEAHDTCAESFPRVDQNPIKTVANNMSGPRK